MKKEKEVFCRVFSAAFGRSSEAVRRVREGFTGRAAAETASAKDAGAALTDGIMPAAHVSAPRFGLHV